MRAVVGLAKGPKGVKRGQRGPKANMSTRTNLHAQNGGQSRIRCGTTNGGREEREEKTKITIRCLCALFAPISLVFVLPHRIVNRQITGLGSLGGGCLLASAKKDGKKTKKRRRKRDTGEWRNVEEEREKWTTPIHPTLPTRSCPHAAPSLISCKSA